MQRPFSRSAIAWVFLLLGGAAAVEAQPFPCQAAINALPYTISLPGHYCLTRNIATPAGTAITIQADHVVLDLLGFEIRSTAPATELTNGVFADSRVDVQVRNGSLRGFYGAILLAGSATPGRAAEYAVHDVRVRDSGFFGIQIDGFDSVVRGSTVTNTGGSPLLANTGGNAYGITLLKGAAQAIDNSVLGFYPSNAGTATGIWVKGGNFVLINNRVEGGTTGPHVGLRMDSTEAGYRDNVVWRVATPFVGGVDLGNNSSF